MAQYSIKELENLSGIKAHTIRIWEKRYNIIEPERTDTNIRYYNDEDLKKLLNICILNRHGIRISKIASLSLKELSEKVINITNDSHDPSNYIENLILAMIDLDEAQFEKVLSKLIMKIGFEEAVIKVIFPFFNRIGILWQAGQINPVHEHFVTNLIRQKLFTAIDSIMIPEGEESKKILLFLPEGEYHEMGLLFYYYLLKKAGQRVYYFGSSVPLDDIRKTCIMVKPDILLTSLTSTLDSDQPVNSLISLAREFPLQKILIGGHLYNFFDESDLPENMSQIPVPSNTKEFLDYFSI